MDQDKSADAKSRAAPPYVSYKTFRNFLDGLGETLPTRIDRSLMGTMSGATQSQLISALKYLGLVTEKELPTMTLKQFHAVSPDERKALLHRVVEQAYPFLFNSGFDLKGTTLQHLEQQFRDETGASGATIERCINFFRAAANDVGIELSPYLSKARSRRPRGSFNTRKGKQKPDSGEVDQWAAHQRKRPVSSRTVQLRSGAGEITLSYNVDLFELDSDDQVFVLDLIGRMKKYEDDDGSADGD